MKKWILYFVCLLLLSIHNLTFSDVGIKLRPLVGMGYNLGQVDVGSGNNNPFLLGGQIIFYFNSPSRSQNYQTSPNYPNSPNYPKNQNRQRKNYRKSGLDGGFGFNFNFIQTHTSEFGDFKKRTEFFNFAIIGEVRAENGFLVQGGYGFYFPIGDNEVTEYGFMFAMGWDISITEWLSFPILARLDLVDENFATMTFNSGFTFIF